MVKGKTNKEIAQTLFVSEKTIKTHVSQAYLINYKLRIEHKLPFMLWKIN